VAENPHASSQPLLASLPSSSQPRSETALRRHPERSRSSGEEKDLPLTRSLPRLRAPQFQLLQSDVILSPARAGRGTLRPPDTVDAVPENPHASSQPPLAPHPPHRSPRSETVLRCHPERSRSSGGEKDLPLTGSVPRLRAPQFQWLQSDVILSPARAGRGTLRPPDSLDAAPGNPHAPRFPLCYKRPTQLIDLSNTIPRRRRWQRFVPTPSPLKSRTHTPCPN